MLVYTPITHSRQCCNYLISLANTSTSASPNPPFSPKRLLTCPLLGLFLNPKFNSYSTNSTGHLILILSLPFSQIIWFIPYNIPCKLCNGLLKQDIDLIERVQRRFTNRL